MTTHPCLRTMPSVGGVQSRMCVDIFVIRWFAGAAPAGGCRTSKGTCVRDPVRFSTR